jgi:hypothetical protein
MLKLLERSRRIARLLKESGYDFDAKINVTTPQQRALLREYAQILDAIEEQRKREGGAK